MTCYMCQQEKLELFYLPIYAKGSEGIDICLSCRILLTDFARDKAREATKRKIKEHKNQIFTDDFMERNNINTEDD